VFRNHNHLENQ